jgi:hypothetical protein
MDSKPYQAAQVADYIGRAKTELIRALRAAEYAGLPNTAELDRLCGRVETLEGKFCKQAEAA